MRKEMDAVLSCMVSEKTGPGEINKKLSETAKDTFFAEAALPLRSCATALRYALDALGVKPGSSVIISALSPVWHYKCVMQLGFTPVLAEVDAETAQLTAETVRDAIARGGSVLLLFDALGFLPDVRSILALGIPVIEDISQSAGAFYCQELPEDEDESISEGDFFTKEESEAECVLPDNAYVAGSGALFSILGLEERDLLTAGGGAILLAPARSEGVTIRKMFEGAPETDILSDMNSSLALVQIKEMKKNRKARALINESFTHSIMRLRAARHKPLSQIGRGEPSFYSFPVIVDSAANDVLRYASRQGISASPAFVNSTLAFLGDSIEGFMNAKSLLMRCILFPLYPRLGAKNIEKIARVLRSLP